MEIPLWLDRIVVTVAGIIGIESTHFVKSVVITLLILAVVVVAVAVAVKVRALLSGVERSSNSNSEAEAKTRIIDAALKPSGGYERMIHDVVETSLFPVNRRIKRLENKVFGAFEGMQSAQRSEADGIDGSLTNTAAAAQLYDDVQDVVLPQEEGVTEETKVQDVAQHVATPVEGVEGEEFANEERTSVAPITLRKNNNEHTASSSGQESEQQEVSPAEDDSSVPPTKVGLTL